MSRYYILNNGYDEIGGRWGKTVYYKVDWNGQNPDYIFERWVYQIYGPRIELTYEAHVNWSIIESSEEAWKKQEPTQYDNPSRAHIILVRSSNQLDATFLYDKPKSVEYKDPNADLLDKSHDELVDMVARLRAELDAKTYKPLG